MTSTERPELDWFDRLDRGRADRLIEECELAETFSRDDRAELRTVRSDGSETARTDQIEPITARPASSRDHRARRRSLLTACPRTKASARWRRKGASRASTRTWYPSSSRIGRRFRTNWKTRRLEALKAIAPASVLGASSVTRLHAAATVRPAKGPASDTITRCRREPRLMSVEST